MARKLIPFEVFNRWSGDIQFTAKIDCSVDELPSVKLGLAVNWGFANGARLDRASLDGATLNRARLVGARLDGASLVGASLIGASLIGASLDGASLDQASLDGARLDGAILDGASLVEASLDRASLIGARLVGARLSEAEIVARLVARATRISDGYEGFLWLTDKGEFWIKAGCQYLRLADFRTRAEGYTNAEKRAETLRIVEYFEACAKASPKLEDER